MIHQLEKAIYVDRFIIDNEYNLLYGSKRNEIVGFSFYHTRKEKQSSIRPMIYSRAINLAREKRNDGRYRNYEYFITQLNHN